MTYPTTNTAITAIVDGASYPKATDVNPAFADLDGVKTMLGVNGGSWIGEGQMMNGKLSVTVSGNDLIVALKTIAGTDPSASDPVYIRINGTVRKCTAALSKTLADGTSWFGSGAVGLGTQEIDYFAYAIWNTTPATDIMDLGFARVPYFSVYSEASGTTTNEKYLAYANASAPAATDDMVNIGRFAATLSLTGTGHLWTVPTFTTINLKQRPWFDTRLLTYTPTWASSGTAVSLGNATLTGNYRISMRSAVVRVAFAAGNTTTFGTGSYTWTVPFASVSSSFGSAQILDSGTAHYVATAGVIGSSMSGYTHAGSSTVGAAIPMTWANADEWNAQVTIEV